VLLSGGNLRPHRFWIGVFLLGTLLSAGWFGWETYRRGAFPGGSSLPGFTFGIVGGAICLFEFLLWPRKKLRGWRIGAVQLWLRAHIWLGLLALPVLVLHSGLTLGGLLSATLLILVVVVVFSGLLGLILQQWLPRKMYDEVPAETIHSQVKHVMELQTDELRRMVEETCGPPPEEEGTDEAVTAAAAVSSSAVAVSIQRAAGSVRGKVLEARPPHPRVPNSEPLRLFFREMAEPYLLGNVSDSPLRLPVQAATRFRDLCSRLSPAAHDTASAVEQLCDQRRQLDRQLWLHFWMHCWLWVHLPLSVVLIVLMFVHIWAALLYW
jgi:hypothetical protein